MRYQAALHPDAYNSILNQGYHAQLQITKYPQIGKPEKDNRSDRNLR
ncbi:MAG TPA: hypothetical protein V6D31_09710 [Candidatus Sericytochromatia bacterium]